ncbi:MAG: hypothetical protein ACI867_000695, partial [Glaciecola sp.]
MHSQRLGALLGLLLGLVSLFATAASAATTGPPAGDALVVAQASSQVTGTIRSAGDTLQGVVLVAADATGAEVGRATTDEGGQWTIAVPGAGEYTVTIDVTSLPEGIELGEGTEATQPVTVGAGSKSVAFRVIASDGSGNTSQSGVSRFLNLLVQGVKLGAIIAMTSVGLSLIFGVTGLVNFAHGEIVTFGAIIAFYLNVGGMTLGVAILLALGLAFTGSVLAEKQLFAGMRKRTPAQGKTITAGGMAAIAVVSVAIAIMASRGGVTLIVAAVLAALAGAVLGGGLELGLFKPLRRRGTGLVSMLVITIGLSFLLRHIFLLGTVFGSAPRRYNDYALQ